MKPSVLITRPRDEAQAFADAVAALGFTPVIEPLLSVDLIHLKTNISADAIVATSPQVFKHDLSETWKGLPLFVMGQASRQLAQDQGFKNIFSADGEFAELSGLIKKNIPAGKEVLYLRGETIRHDLKASLSEYLINEQIAYKTDACQNVSLNGLQNGTIQIVTLFSPRSAALFNNLIVRANMADALRGIKVLCLSAAVLESVKSLPWEQVRLAQRPDQQGMLDALQGWA